MIERNTNDDYCEMIKADNCTPIEYELDEKSSNDCINNLINISSFNITNAHAAEKAFERKGELGFFNLFFIENLRERITDWTNQHCTCSGAMSISKSESNIFLGLEMVMSLKKGIHIRDNWSTKPFMHDPFYSTFSSRDKHQNIRSNMQMHPPYLHDSECDKCENPLWHSQHMLHAICKIFSMRAHISGAISFDELLLGTKCRTRANTCIPNKPDKFGIRFCGLSSARLGL